MSRRQSRRKLRWDPSDAAARPPVRALARARGRVVSGGVSSAKQSVQVRGTIYTWTFGETVFEVDAARGARFTRFSLGGQNILTGPEVNALNYGSTFWTSPQSQWGWPPPVEVDSEPYVARIIDDARGMVSFTGKPDPKLGLAVIKTIAVDPERAQVMIEYALSNQSSETRTVAPWEISRHPPQGLTFFPAGAGIEPQSNLAVTRVGGAIWFAYDAAAITGDQKLFAHGVDGWLAHIDAGRRLALIKTFPEVVPGEQAPGEAAIEFYADPGHTYVEVEQQGAYRPLQPGAQARWTVTWRLRGVPAEIAVRAGSAALFAWARALSAT